MLSPTLSPRVLPYDVGLSSSGLPYDAGLSPSGLPYEAGLSLSRLPWVAVAGRPLSWTSMFSGLTMNGSPATRASQRPRASLYSTSFASLPLYAAMSWRFFRRTVMPGRSRGAETSWCSTGGGLVGGGGACESLWPMCISSFGPSPPILRWSLASARLALALARGAGGGDGGGN